MKLSPISVEQALQSAAEATYPVPAVITGPIERGLRFALRLFGPDGEYWIKNREKDFVPAHRRMISADPVPVLDLLGCSHAIQTVEYHDVPNGTGYCTIGAMKESPCKEGIRMVFLRVTGIESIPNWNDHPARSFRDVKFAFERAIAYAQEKSL